MLPGQQGLEPADAWPHRSLTERRELHRDPEAADDRRVARRRHESDARQVAQPPGRGQPRAEAAVRALTYMERDSLVSHDEMDLARLPRRDTARQRQDRPDRARAGDGQLHQRLHDDGDGRRLDGAVLDEEGSRRPRRRREGERAVGRRRRRSEQGPGRAALSVQADRLAGGGRRDRTREVDDRVVDDGLRRGGKGDRRRGARDARRGDEERETHEERAAHAPYCERRIGYLEVIEASASAMPMPL